MEVLLLLLLSSIFTVPSEGKGKDHCQNATDCQDTEYCNSDKICDCKAGFFDEHRDSCKKCPAEGEECVNCCYPPETLACYQDEKNHKTCNAHFNHSFIMAAQVALGAALAIAFVALIALFWKTCPRGNSRGGLSSLLPERESSLTSIQRIVLQRLRDRPPRYDDNNQIQLEKPPAYEEVANITNSQVPEDSPPRYSAASIQEGDESKQEESRDSQEQRDSTSRSASTSSGVVNHAFTIVDEGTGTRHKPDEQKEENDRSRTGSSASGIINIVLRNEETPAGHMQTEHYI